MTNLPANVLRLLLILPAIILHEVAHGYAAYLLGDDTAKRAGRLTLNPISHIDPFGTLLLPALLVLSGSPILFGYAKPVPIGVWNFRDRQTGMLITGVAGPAANLVMAVLAGLPLRFMAMPAGLQLFDVSSVFSILLTFCFLNLVLLFFNLVPIPPLDGSRVIQWFLHGQALAFYEQIERFGFIIVFGVLFLLPGVFDAYLGATVFPLVGLITGVRFG